MNIAKIVREAREQSRLTTLDFATGIFDDFIQLHGDRSFRDDGAVVGGIGWLGDQAVTVVGIQKGKSLQDNLKRNFGQPHPEGYSKALRLMKQAEKFGRPVVTFINTAGAYPGVGAEERGQGEPCLASRRISVVVNTRRAATIWRSKWRCSLKRRWPNFLQFFD